MFQVVCYNISDRSIKMVLCLELLEKMDKHFGNVRNMFGRLSSLEGVQMPSFPKKINYLIFVLEEAILAQPSAAEIVRPRTFQAILCSREPVISRWPFGRLLLIVTSQIINHRR